MTVGRGFLSATDDRPRLFLEAVPDAMMIVEGDGTIAFANRLAERMFGFEPGKLVDQPVESLLSEAAGEGHAGLRASYLEGLRSQAMGGHGALVGRRSDGSVFPAEISLSSFESEGRMLVCAAIRDVTARREAEASHAELHRSIAELRRPLRVARASLELVAESGYLDSEDREGLQDALVCVNRTLEIVASIKRDAGPDKEEGRPASNLASALSAAVRLADHELTARAALEVEVDVEPGVMVPGTETRLVQVFLNLLRNAAQALDPEQRPRNRVKVRVGRDREFALVEVTDNGPGIPAAIRKESFEPFFPTKAAGTGLGLAVTAQILRELGGNLDVRSVEGEGAMFRAILPVAAELPGPALAKGPDRGSGVRILAVDDDQGTLRVVRHMLSPRTVTAVTSVPEALRALEEGGFDLVLCDVIMPERSGVDLFLEVARRWPGREATIVFMTGGSFTDAQRAALARWSPQVLTKPFTMTQVAPLLRHIA